MNSAEKRPIENRSANEYPVKTMMRSMGCYPGAGSTEEQSNYTSGLILTEMLMEGKSTIFNHEGERLDPEDAARTAADAWDTDPDKLVAAALELAPVLKLRRDDPKRYSEEMSKRWREMDEKN